VVGTLRYMVVHRVARTIDVSILEKESHRQNNMPVVIIINNNDNCRYYHMKCEMRY
jgi:hypothetical protein